MVRVDSPIQIGTKTAKNRITMAPTVKFDWTDDSGIVTERSVRHYAARAEHGAGLICVEATCVAKDARLSPTQIGLWDDSQIEGHKKLVDAVHAYGALVIPQLHYGGYGTHPACGPKRGPSVTEWRDGMAAEMTVEEIHTAVGQFRDAAVRAQKAGYDGVQMHACHNYVINNFASALNKRTDEYGGSPEGRARFGCEIIRAIREACGKDFIISMRASGFDPTEEEAQRICECYVEAGCDYLQISCGYEDPKNFPHDPSLPYNSICAMGVHMHDRFRGIVPVSTVNGIRTPELARYLIENELVDTIDIACGLLADPALSEAILYGAPYEKCRGCLRCGYGPGKVHFCPAAKARGVEE